MLANLKKPEVYKYERFSTSRDLHSRLLSTTLTLGGKGGHHNTICEHELFCLPHTHRYPEEGCKNVLLLLTCGTAGGPDQPAGRKDGPEAASACVSTGRPADRSAGRRPVSKTDTPDSWRAGWRSGGRAGQPTGQRAGGERAGYTSRMAGELGGWLVGY